MITKAHCIHLQNHKKFVDDVRELNMCIQQSKIIPCKVGEPIYIIAVEGTTMQHKELANRVFNTLSSEEVILARERTAIWRSFFEE